MFLWVCPGVLLAYQPGEQQGLAYRMIHAPGVGESIKPCECEYKNTREY